MNIVQRAYRKAYVAYRRRAFDAAAPGILQTPPLQMHDSGLLFVSMACHADVARYLLALKSLYRFVQTGAALIINDGTLTDDDCAILRHHVPLLRFVHINTITTDPCPRGGMWERLLHIIDLTATHYVIQIDADTLTQAPVPELVAAWEQNRSWLLGTDVGQEVKPAAEVAAMVRTWPEKPDNICMTAEIAVGETPEFANTGYVHASAGFAGFARGAFARGPVEAFSQRMQGVVGRRWADWGTEQVASNWVIANAPDALVLPFDRYACFEPWVDPKTRAFLHFIGTYRYDSGVYERMARGVIAACARG